LKIIILTLLLSVAVFSQTITKIVDSRPIGSRTFVASAYCLTGKMANGQRVHAGAIAADPRILPIGSRVLIENMGIFTVKDTGGDIKGNRIDIWYSSCRTARIFGKKKVLVKKLEKKAE